MALVRQCDKCKASCEAHHMDRDMVKPHYLLQGVGNGQTRWQGDLCLDCSNELIDWLKTPEKKPGLKKE